MSDPWEAEGKPVILSVEQLRSVTSWVAFAQQALGLSDHDIHVSPRKCSDDDYAISSLRERSTEQWIAVSPKFVAADGTSQRQALTHELVHAYFQPIHALTMKAVEDEFGNTGEAMFRCALLELEERTIDRMAYALARFLPEFLLE